MTYSAEPGKDTLANDLIQQLNEFSLECRTPSQFEVAAFKREIEKVKHADLADYYGLLGMLSALELDAGSTHTNHRRALEIAGNGPYQLAHYAVSLIKLYEFDAAIRLLERALEKDPADLDVLKSLISTAMSSGRYRYAKSCLDAWNSRFPDERHRDSKLLNECIVPFLEKKGLSDDDVASIYSRAHGVLKERRLITSHEAVRWLDDNDDHEGGLAFVIGLNEPVERVADVIEDFCIGEADQTWTGSVLNVVVSFNPVAA